jgi:hypothetical protein
MATERAERIDAVSKGFARIAVCIANVNADARAVAGSDCQARERLAVRVGTVSDPGEALDWSRANA